MKVPLERIRSLAGQLTYSFVYGRQVWTKSRVHQHSASGKTERDIAQFHLDEMPRLGKSRDNEISGCQGPKEGGMGVTANGCGVSFWLDEK